MMCFHCKQLSHSSQYAIQTSIVNLVIRLQIKTVRNGEFLSKTVFSRSYLYSCPQIEYVNLKCAL